MRWRATTFLSAEDTMTDFDLVVVGDCNADLLISGGDDIFGRFMRESLETRGVDMSAVRTDPRIPTGLSVHLIRGDDRAIITNPGTIPELRSQDIDADLLASARHVHVS